MPTGQDEADRVLARKVDVDIIALQPGELHYGPGSLIPIDGGRRRPMRVGTPGSGGSRLRPGFIPSNGVIPTGCHEGRGQGCRIHQYPG